MNVLSIYLSIEVQEPPFGINGLFITARILFMFFSDPLSLMRHVLPLSLNTARQGNARTESEREKMTDNPHFHSFPSSPLLFPNPSISPPPLSRPMPQEMSDSSKRAPNG